jgi:enoyl-CoA hydratase/carnithine racemase
MGPPLDLALACDVRVAAAAAEFQFTAFGARRQLALLRRAAAVEVFEREGRLRAADALPLGLVSAVADPLPEALRLASVIASRGPIATRLAKEAIWRGLELPLEHALRFETDLTLLLQTTKDRAEGVSAFLEKRPPTFRGE